VSHPPVSHTQTKATAYAFESADGTGTKPLSDVGQLYKRIEVNMNFFIQMKPPTATAQEKKVRVIHGKPLFFDPAPVKEAKQELTAYLLPHKPEVPLEGPLSLSVIWLFPKGKSHKHGEWRVTRPDTDNLEKMLKDCMTRTGFWKDDAQVVREVVEKRWSDEPSGIYIEIEKLEDHHEPL
jgi:crossover junction endodeoxyribonuclease RusA